jgi:hypothetical protein
MSFGVKHYQGATLNTDNLVNGGFGHGDRPTNIYILGKIKLRYPKNL